MSLVTVAEVVKGAGPEQIRPHLPLLVPALLESLSGMEVPLVAASLSFPALRARQDACKALQGTPVGWTPPKHGRDAPSKHTRVKTVWALPVLTGKACLRIILACPELGRILRLQRRWGWLPQWVGWSGGCLLHAERAARSVAALLCLHLGCHPCMRRMLLVNAPKALWLRASRSCKNICEK